jgi:hypothetical protein
MVTRILVGLKASAVEQFLTTLDSAHFPFVAAFWQEATDERAGELVIVSPEVDQIGSLAVYERIQGLLARLPGRLLTLDDVKVIGETDPMMARLRRVVPSDFPIEQVDVRFSVPDETSEDSTLVNLHIYRWRLPDGSAAATPRG